MNMFRNFFKQYGVLVAWGQSVLGMAGSLYFSEFRHFPPCILCWYQRICLYPLVAILTVGIIRKDKNVVFYGLPVAIIGAAISIYHNLLYYKILPESAAPCTAGISCTTKFVEYYGFITIPLLSFCAFLVIIVSLGLYNKFNKNG